MVGVVGSPVINSSTSGVRRGGGVTSWKPTWATQQDAPKDLHLVVKTYLNHVLEESKSQSNEPLLP